MSWNLLSSLASAPVKEIAEQTGKAIGSVLDRFGFTKKMSEEQRLDKYVSIFGISENSTQSAREMCMTEAKTQKQPWLIRLLNGFVRPFGGIGSLITEFYVIWAENFSVWFNFEYRPITLTTEQHIFLGTCVAFYFGSRLKETLSGVSVRR